MDDEVCTYAHGEVAIIAKHPRGDEMSWFGCYLRLRPEDGSAYVPPVRGTSQVQPRLSLHLVHLSFGLGGDDNETVFDVPVMQRLLHAAVLFDGAGEDDDDDDDDGSVDDDSDDDDAEEEEEDSLGDQESDDRSGDESHSLDAAH